MANPPGAAATGELYGDERYFVNPDFGAVEAGGFHGYRDYLADRRRIEDKFEEVLARVERLAGDGRRLRDVGAGPGFMLAAAQRRGWDAQGLDLNPWAVDYARRELAVEVRRGDLLEAELPAASFDAVTMMDLVEHVPDPAHLLVAAARVLRPGGVLAVLTPDAGAVVSRALGRRWPEVERAPEHLVLFSLRGLAALLGRCGFQALESHSVGKTSSLATLVSEVAPIAGGLAGPLERALGALGLAERELTLDARTKFCLYARRGGDAPATGAPARAAEGAP